LIKFSLILPVKDCSDSLATTLDSIKNQEFNDYEVIIIDGSRDNQSAVVVDEFRKRGMPLRYFHGKDRNVYDAMNKGVRQSKGRWLYFIGAGDTLYDSKVLKRVSSACSTSGSDVIYGNVFAGKYSGFAEEGSIYDGFFTLKKLAKKNICHQAIFYRREILAKRKFNDNFEVCADWDLNLYCWANFSVHYIGIIIANFAGGGISSKSEDLGFSRAKRRLINNYSLLSQKDSVVGPDEDHINHADSAAPIALINFIALAFGVRVFFETGTFRGKTVRRLAGVFEKLITVEGSKEIFESAKSQLSGYHNIVNVYGDSVGALQAIVPKINVPIVFWLDAHFSGGATHGREDECNVLDELATINQSLGEHIILVDDARLFYAPPPQPHDPRQWPSITQVVEALSDRGRRFVGMYCDTFFAVPMHLEASTKEFLIHKQAYDKAHTSRPAEGPESLSHRLSLGAELSRIKINRDGIIHVGAHTGQELRDYLALGYREILLIEANPVVFEELKQQIVELKNAGKIKSGVQVRAVNVAISDRRGTVVLNVNSNSESSSILPLKYHESIFPDMTVDDKFIINALTLDAVLAAAKRRHLLYDTLVMDIQGAELMALAGASKTLQMIDVAVLEINFSELYQGCASAYELDDFMKKKGFTRTVTACPHKLFWGDALYVRQSKFLDFPVRS